jgi:hypothetical protein
MATPILTERAGGNNRPSGVIHRLGTLESCVFHSVHIFFGNPHGSSGKVRLRVRKALESISVVCGRRIPGSAGSVR